MFEYTIMSFELKNAPTTFQAIISKILQEYLKNFVITYLNNITVYSIMLKKYKSHVRKVLKILQKEGLRLKLKKCKFHVQRIKFLKWILSSEFIEINSNKLDSILIYLRSETKKQFLRFLGITVFFKNAISEYFHKTVSLTDLLRKDIKFIWTREQKQTFQKMKNMFRALQALRNYDSKEKNIREDKRFRQNNKRMLMSRFQTKSYIILFRKVELDWTKLYNRK